MIHFQYFSMAGDDKRKPETRTCIKRWKIYQYNYTCINFFFSLYDTFIFNKTTIGCSKIHQFTFLSLNCLQRLQNTRLKSQFVQLTEVFTALPPCLAHTLAYPDKHIFWTVLGTPYTDRQMDMMTMLYHNMPHFYKQTNKNNMMWYPCFNTLKMFKNNTSANLAPFYLSYW